MTDLETNHLGNVRVSYTKDPQTGNLKILDESHYYPFGLKHQEYSTFGFVSNPIQGVILRRLPIIRISTNLVKKSTKTS